MFKRLILIGALVITMVVISDTNANAQFDALPLRKDRHIL